MSFKRTTLIFVGCICMLVGLGLAHFFDLRLPVWCLVFAPAFIVLKRKNLAALILVVMAGLAIGLWRGSVYMQHLDELRTLMSRKVTIQLTASSDAVYGKKSQLDFTASHALLIKPYTRLLMGNFKISGHGENMVYRGDIIMVTGRLYPGHGSNQASISYAQISRIQADSSWINSLTRKFSAGMQSSLPEPQASFGLGLLIGQRSGLPQDIIAQMMLVGVIHIVAVSGYNVTILARGIARLKLGSKHQRLLLSLAVIGLFILVTGFSASIVRAGLVALLSLWAWYYGRRIRPIVLISFAAAFTGLLNPFYVWSDLGWWLSFLAFFGVLIIAPVLAKRIFRRSPKALTMVVIETLAAEIMTLPLIAMSFGRLSLIGLAANVLIVPLVPIAMLFSAIAATAGALAPQIAGWLAWPAKELLTYMLDVVHMLSGVHWAVLQISLSLLELLSIYAAVVLITLVIYQRAKGKNAIITDKKNLVSRGSRVRTFQMGHN